MALERPVAPDHHDLLPDVPSFDVESDDITDDQPLGDEFTHPSVDGKNTSPQLRWSGFPEETKSFAVTCFDPDAPTGSGFWHWAAVNIPADVTELPRGASGNLPGNAVEVRNDFGDQGYGGAAPPSGDRVHRYVFTVWAVDTEELAISPDTPPAQVGFNLSFHGIARGAIRPTYQT